MKYHKIFFSYSRKDADFALKLALDLKKEGYDVWIDQEDIRAGSEWDVEIENALVTCDCLLFIQSENSVASNNVLDEVYYALGKDKRVIPVVINSCNTPYRISRLQRVSFIESYNNGLTNLKDNLSNGSFSEITTSDKGEIKKLTNIFHLKYLPIVLLLIVATVTIIYFINIKPQSNKNVSKNIDPESFAGEWALKNIIPDATEKKGYLKIENIAHGKANIKSSFQFYYVKTNDTAFLNVFNGYVECMACILKDSMIFMDKQIDVGAQKYTILKENQANGKRGDTTLNAGLNTSIRAAVTLHLINKDSIIINVINPGAFTTSDGISIPAFTYSFLFGKEL